MFGAAGDGSTSTARTASTGASTSSASPTGTGAAVLLRALEPTHGLDEMRARRGGVVDAAALRRAGPAHAGARASTAADDGALRSGEPPFALAAAAGPVEVVADAPRIGITKAVELTVALRRSAGRSWVERAAHDQR